MRRISPWLMVAFLAFLGQSCDVDDPPNSILWNQTTAEPRTDFVSVVSPTGENEQHIRPHLRDSRGRYLNINGINVGGSDKFPVTEDFQNLQLWKNLDTKEVSYVGKPWPADEMDKNLQRIQKLGFNTIRVVMNWESIMPDGPDQFDEKYLDYIEELVDRAQDHGIYCLMDMHQDMFSRHLFVRYNRYPTDPETGERFSEGSLEGMLLSLVPPYNNWIRGHGAPAWVVQLCLPEKKMDSEHWGKPKLLGGIGLGELTAFADLLMTFLPDDGSGTPPWVDTIVEGLSELGQYDVNETSDMMPWSLWGLNLVTSLDVQRAFAMLYAGQDIYPDYTMEVGGKSVHVQAFLEAQYTKAWMKVVERVKDKKNVIGYDIMNEPVGFFITLAAVAAYFDTGLDTAARDVIYALAGEDLGENIWTIVKGLQVLPPDTTDETRQKWGFEGANLMAMVNLNLGYDKKYLFPFFERVGQAIQEEDSNAIIWFETSIGMTQALGEGGGLPVFQMNPTKLKGIKQQVYAPHWYPDIYPYPGINMGPREFDEEEWKYRDFTKELEAIKAKVDFSMSGIPVIFGEFGTYFNFNGLQAAKDSDFSIPAYILDSYYRAFESLGLGKMVWCYSPENTDEWGEGWNLEDFSVIGSNQKPRGQYAYVRPHARATSGQPIESHFYSPYRYLEPDKATPLPVGEFFLKMEAKETEAPTEIFVPEIQYPTGFYVWVSDGICYFDPKHQLLHWYPTNDSPGAEHTIKLLPPRPGADVRDWDYFFNGDKVLSKGGVQ